MLSPPFSEETEQQMRDFFHSLNEKDRRRYAGLEAGRLGHGGISYIALTSISYLSRRSFTRSQRGGDVHAVLIACRTFAPTFWKFFDAILPAIRCGRRSSGPT